MYNISIESKLQYLFYNTASQDGDYGLIFLDEPSKIAPVNVNTKTNVPSTNQQLTVMGWGTTEYGALPNIPLETTVDVLSNNECAHEYGVMSPITDNMLCAFGGSDCDACQGDLGGPLIIKGRDAGDDILVGLASWG